MPKNDSSTLILALRLFKAIPVFNFIEHNAFKETVSALSAHSRMLFPQLSVGAMRSNGVRARVPEGVNHTRLFRLVRLLYYIESGSL